MKRKSLSHREWQVIVRGNWKGKETTVIDGDYVLQHVGVGWIKTRKTTRADRKKYPRLED